MPRTSVAIVSESTLCRAGTADLLRRDGCHVAECVTGAQLVAAARTRAVDVLILDGDHVHHDLVPHLTSLAALVAHRRLVVLALPHRLATLALDAIEVETPDFDPVVFRRAIRGKSPRASTDLVRARRAWAAITPRQRDVLRWLAIGCDNGHIAHRLHIGIRAVKAHITVLLDLFELDNRVELALIAYRAGQRPRRAH